MLWVQSYKDKKKNYFKSKSIFFKVQVSLVVGFFLFNCMPWHVVVAVQDRVGLSKYMKRACSLVVYSWWWLERMRSLQKSGIICDFQTREVWLLFREVLKLCDVYLSSWVNLHKSIHLQWWHSSYPISLMGLWDFYGVSCSW